MKPSPWQAVGAYSGSEDQEEIYVPLSFWCDPAWFTGKKPPLSDGERPVYDFNNEEERNGYIYSITSFSTCKFILDSAYELNRFRDYLTDQNISQVGTLNQNRITVVLQDQAFTETAGRPGALCRVQPDSSAGSVRGRNSSGFCHFLADD